MRPEPAALSAAAIDLPPSRCDCYGSRARASVSLVTRGRLGRVRGPHVKASIRTSAYALLEFSALALLLFVVRFILRGHLVPQLDEECALGGVAVDVLARGIRFPLAMYAPNDYENGFFYSGLLTAGSFAALGQRALALKLPTHLIVSAGAAAALWLLRSCLDELRLRARWARATAIAVLVIAFAFSPREIALFSTYAVGIGSHAEGSAIDMALLAVFARRRADWAAPGIAAFWVLLGLALHVNKGTLVLVGVLALVELGRMRSAPRGASAALLGFLIGSVPELIRMTGADAVMGGWGTITAKLARHGRDFPAAFVSDVLTLADYRPELLAVWTLAIGLATALTLRSSRRRAIRGGAAVPSAIGMTLGVLVLHLAGLAIIAQGGVDYYALHTYPPLAVLTALLAGWSDAALAKIRSVGSARAAAALIIGPMLVAYRPEAPRADFGVVSALWNERGGAACSWRFGETFVRLQAGAVDYSLLGTAALPEHDRRAQATRVLRAVALCRSLSETVQALDCIGGIARELQYGSGRIDGEPPAELNSGERRAYAFYYGVRRDGDLMPCDDFHEAALRNDCRTAVRIDCFVRADVTTRFASGRSLGRPRCNLPPPPMDGYWAARRLDLLSRPTRNAPEFPPEFSDKALGACKAVVAACY